MFLLLHALGMKINVLFIVINNDTTFVKLRNNNLWTLLMKAVEVTNHSNILEILSNLIENVVSNS